MCADIKKYLADLFWWQICTTDEFLSKDGIRVVHVTEICLQYTELQPGF